MKLKPMLAGFALAGVALGTSEAQFGGLGPVNMSSPIAVTRALGLLGNYKLQRLLTVAGADPNDPAYATPKGGAVDGVAALVIERSDLPGFFAICTGALLSSGVDILTAGHCLADETGHVTATRATAVFFPPGQPASIRELVTGTNFHVNPLYTGESLDAHDIGTIRLANAPTSPGITGYQLYGGNPVGKTFQTVGIGETGTGTNGSVPGSFGVGLSNRRTGLNTFDYSFTDSFFGGFFDDVDFFGPADPNVLVSDFDNGTLDQNSSCLLAAFFAAPPAAFCGFGLGSDEVDPGQGDSGGPGFINGQIASVTSFNLTFGTALGDIDDDLNSTFGEFAGYTRVDLNRGWIESVAPEPGTMTLVFTGLLGLAGVARRRRSR
jgi:hypothetical protein